MRISIDPLPELKITARQKIEDHFNNLAMANLHRDLVVLARGGESDVLKRDTTRTSSLSMIENAARVDDIEAALNAIGLTLNPNPDFAPLAAAR